MTTNTIPQYPLERRPMLPTSNGGSCGKRSAMDGLLALPGLDARPEPVDRNREAGDGAENDEPPQQGDEAVEQAAEAQCHQHRRVALARHFEDEIRLAIDRRNRERLVMIVERHAAI